MCLYWNLLDCGRVCCNSAHSAHQGKTQMKIKQIFITLISIPVILVSSTTFAVDGAAIYTAKGCMACHGADAKSAIMPTYPNLAGQNAAYLLEQMKDIKSGARNNGQTAVMKGIIASVSDDEMDALAKYLAGLK